MRYSANLRLQIRPDTKCGLVFENETRRRKLAFANFPNKLRIVFGRYGSPFRVVRSQNGDGEMRKRPACLGRPEAQFQSWKRVFIRAICMQILRKR